jgi:hypothetical protein
VIVNAELPDQSEVRDMLARMSGVHQPEALGLYERFGFVRCEPFGDDRPDPLSVFMEMRL